MNVESVVTARPIDPATYRYGGQLPPDSVVLEDLLKATDIQQLFESYYTLLKIPVAIIDLEANVLFSSRWQRICTQYHRVHPETCARCLESDTQLSQQLTPGRNFASYACRNGLMDCAAPIVIEGKHLANVFIGQFLTQPPDDTRFRAQAEAFGFEVDDYLAAIHEIPVVDEDRIPAIFDLLVRMTRVITTLAHDRKRALEDRSRQSTILDTIPQAVFWKDLEGRYLGCNAAFAKAAGLGSPAEVLGKTDFDLPWARDEAEAYRTDDQAILASNRPRLHIVEPLQQADGSRIVIETSKVPLHDALGTPHGVLGIYEDITEKFRKAEQLCEAEARFRTLSDHSLVGIYMIQDRRFTYVNTALAAIFGYDAPDLVGRDPLDLIHPEDRAQVAENMQLRLAGEAVPEHYVFRGLRKDGGLRFLEVFSAATTTANRPAIIGNLLDITDRRAASEALRESEAHRRAMFESARDALLIMQKGRFVECNHAALSLFGSDPASLLGHAPDERFSPPFQADGRPSRIAALERIELALHGVPQFFDWNHLRLDGTPFEAEVSLNRIDHGEAEGLLLAIVRDVSERKRGEAQVAQAYEQAKQTLDDTIATMSKIIEMRDPYTAGHQGRVTRLAVSIAEEMGQEATFIGHLRMAALIHDIGKINIGAEILSKPGDLSDLEMQLIMTHAQSGFDIVRNMNLLPEVAQTILQHHERFDGSGYPQGLKGGDIRLEARIIAVADVVEAMASHRPYRTARGIEAALEEVSAHSGQHYDPEVCAACLRVFHERGFQFRTEDSLRGVSEGVDLKPAINFRARGR